LIGSRGRVVVLAPLFWGKLFCLGPQFDPLFLLAYGKSCPKENSKVLMANPPFEFVTESGAATTENGSIASTSTGAFLK
jgi:hypothetical protein